MEDVKDNDRIKELERRIERLERVLDLHDRPTGKPSLQEDAILRLLKTLAAGGRPVCDKQWQEEAVRRCFVINAHVFRTVRSRLAKKGLIKRDRGMTWAC
jgi:hypothetical protein